MGFFSSGSDTVKTQTTPWGPLKAPLKYGIKTAFSTAGAAGRTFKRIPGVNGAPTRLKPGGSDYFDLNPDEDQQIEW
mgnify:CR=1 FL=1